jgi:hypothetical protein
MIFGRQVHWNRKGNEGSKILRTAPHDLQECSNIRDPAVTTSNLTKYYERKSENKVPYFIATK